MLLRIILFFVFLSVCFHTGMVSAQDKLALVIKAGLMRVQPNGYIYVYRETIDIPLITKQEDSEFMWGVTVRGKNKTNMSCHFVIYSPQKKSTRINPAHMVRKDYKLVDAKISRYNKTHKKITSNKFPCRNHIAGIKFNKKDVPGVYFFEVYVDDHLLRRITFTVRKNSIVGVWRVIDGHGSIKLPDSCRNLIFQYGKNGLLTGNDGSLIERKKYKIQRKKGGLLVLITKYISNNGERNCQGLPADYVRKNSLSSMFLELSPDNQTMTHYFGPKKSETYLRFIRIK